MAYIAVAKNYQMFCNFQNFKVRFRRLMIGGRSSLTCCSEISKSASFALPTVANKLNGNVSKFIVPTCSQTF